MIHKTEHYFKYVFILMFLLTVLTNIIVYEKQSIFNLTTGVITCIVIAFSGISFQKDLKKRMIDQMMSNLKDIGGESYNDVGRPRATHKPSRGTPYTM
ncbi:MAG: hypothetical protein KAS32_06755 [Candidatus Peribacteraceae bacterium]|nr:hypothetical protein [Candidatus Peribacteraceae bacterium]